MKIIPYWYKVTISACLLFLSIDVLAQSQLTPQLNRNHESQPLEIGPSAESKLNFVYIIIDDLRTELNAYGLGKMKTPNIDQLASEGVLFENAFSNVPTCGASRASIMTGLYPTPKRFTYWYSRMDEHASGVITLVERLKNNGYHTQSIGKVNHHTDDTPQMWSVKPWMPETVTGSKDYQQQKNIDHWLATGKGPAWESVDVGDFTHKDGRSVVRAINTLAELAKKKQPFFLAIGIEKPHLPFVAPQKYFDMYPTDSISLPEVNTFPKSAPFEAWHHSGELRSYIDMGHEPKNEADDALTISNKIALIRGYKATTSYADSLVGVINNKIKALGLDKNTVVILTGDHGWSLGEHSLWNKHSTFNIAAHSPMIIKKPGIAGGKRVKGVVEFVDIYPTVMSFAKLEAPQHLQGVDLTPALTDENFTKGAIFHRFRWNDAEAVRTARYSYTIFFNKQGQQTAHMLYDLELDRHEATNVADNSEYKAVVTRLKTRLLAHMKNR